MNLLAKLLNKQPQEQTDNVLPFNPAIRSILGGDTPGGQTEQVETPQTEMNTQINQRQPEAMPTEGEFTAQYNASQPLSGSPEPLMQPDSYPNAFGNAESESELAAMSPYDRAKYDYNQLSGATATNQDRGTKGFFRELVSNFLHGVSERSKTNPNANVWELLTAGGAGGVGGAINRNWNEQRGLDTRKERAFGELQRQSAIADTESKRNQQSAAVRNAERDDIRATEEFNSRMEYNKSEQSRKVSDRESRETTSRMNQVSAMFRNIPEYDPTDPKFAELTKALGDVGLPLTPKDVKKKVDLKQDQRTGEWTMILTDPLSGQQEARSVIKDGQPFKSTPTVVMQGEYGMLKQNDQQQFTATENEKNRQVRINLQDDRQEYDRLKKDGSPDSQQKVMRMKVNGRSAVKRGLMTEIEYQSLFGEPSTTEVTGTVGTGAIIQ